MRGSGDAHGGSERPAAEPIVHRLWSRLDELPAERYPPGLVPVPGHVEGTAFFAGGAGLYREEPGGQLPRWPVNGVMFVGNNLDAAVPYLRRLESGQAHGGRERPMGTWRGMYALLDEVGLDPRDCFFTNAYIGLVSGDRPEGPPPGRDDPTFVAWCRSFLAEQIQLMRPRVVATLGTWAARFVAGMSDDLRMRWLPWTSYADLDRRDASYVLDVEVAGSDTTAVALIHPSSYNRQARRIRYGDLPGVEGEAALLRDALRKSTGRA